MIGSFVRYTSFFTLSENLTCILNLALIDKWTVSIVLLMPLSLAATFNVSYFIKSRAGRWRWQYHDVPHDVLFGSRAIKGDKGEFGSRSAIVSGYYTSRLHN
jgi:hypothetical protein